MIKMNLFKKLVVGAAIVSVVLIGGGNVAFADSAENINGQITISNGAGAGNITDGSYDTSVVLGAGESINVKLDKPASGAYFVWGAPASMTPEISYAKPVREWTLKYADKEVKCGVNGFLHEYVSFESEVTEFTMVLDKGNTLTDIKCFGKGDLPENVQVWEPECEKADILLLSTHADDEILFFGGILPYYAGEKDLEVQIIYFSQYYTGAFIREHEKLDGLWHAGVKHYPITGNFDDWYAEDLPQAKELFSEEKATEWVVEMIRRFKPQITVAQDENGEYGHGAHKLTSLAMRNAVAAAGDDKKFEESAKKYGAWDVKKAYLHLYKDNQITLDCRKPLSHFGGKTTLEVAAESYKLHVSQQWCWFYVDDEYEYSCAKYGMYHTTVGNDTGNDIMENIVDYKTQAEEQKRLEEESIKESQSIAEAESMKESESVANEETKKNEEGSSVGKTILKVIGVIVVIAVIAFAGIIVLYVRAENARKKRRKKRKKISSNKTVSNSRNSSNNKNAKGSSVKKKV